MLSRVAVLSGPTSYDRITTVCLYPTPCSMISPCRYESVNCFWVGIFCRTCTLFACPFSETGAGGPKGVAAFAVWPNLSTLVVEKVETPFILMLLSFCLFESCWLSLVEEHLIEYISGHEKEAILFPYFFSSLLDDVDRKRLERFLGWWCD